MKNVVIAILMPTYEIGTVSSTAYLKYHRKTEDTTQGTHKLKIKGQVVTS